MIRVGIVYDTAVKGLGGHGLHLAFLGLPGVRIAALADSNRENLDQRMAILNAETHYSDWRRMLAEEPLDVVAVCSRLPGEHVEIIMAAVQKGCHVLCEKPLCTTAIEAEQIVRRSRECRVRVAVSHLARYALVFQTMKKMMDDGAVGRILTFYGRGKEDSRGGGEDLLVLGTHILDLGVFLFGRPENVYAEISQFGRPIEATDAMPTAEPLGKVAGTDVFAAFRFPNEIRGIFESRRGLFQKQVRMGVTVAGTEGCLSVRYDDQRALRLTRSPYPAEDESAYEIVPLRENRVIPGACPLDYSLFPVSAARYFMDNNRFAAYDLLEAVRNQREPVSSAAQAKLTFEIIEAMYQSAFTGRKVVLPQTWPALPS